MKIKLVILTGLICFGVISTGISQMAHPNTIHSTWDTALCYKDDGQGNTTEYSRCITPMDDGPCTRYTACPDGSAPKS